MDGFRSQLIRYDTTTITTTIHKMYPLNILLLSLQIIHSFIHSQAWSDVNWQPTRVSHAWVMDHEPTAYLPASAFSRSHQFTFIFTHFHEKGSLVSISVYSLPRSTRNDRYINYGTVYYDWCLRNKLYLHREGRSYSSSMIRIGHLSCLSSSETDSSIYRGEFF